MDDWRWWTAAKLGQAIGTGEIDPVELTEVYLAAIEAHELKDRIYARVTPDRARYEAKAAKTPPKRGWSVWAKPICRRLRFQGWG